MSEIQSHMAARPAAVVAQTFLKRWPSASSPFLVTADDGNKYVVKGNIAGRQIVNDQIVARLGEHLGAATGTPALVKVEQAFIDLSPEVKNVGVGPGTWHGLSYVENYSERAGFQHFGLAENRTRFALLAFLEPFQSDGWHYRLRNPASQQLHRAERLGFRLIDRQDR